MESQLAQARPLLEVRNLVHEFTVSDRGGTKGGVLRALSDVSFSVRKGETLGMVGESGSGKSTLARALLQTPRPRSGSVCFAGQELTRLHGSRLLEQRRSMQLIFQDPFRSLNPRWKIADIVAEPLLACGRGSSAQRLHKVATALELVGLPFALYAARRPRELSGGQCQRVAIARALTMDPALLICDEALSALDALIQAQLLNLFEQLRKELGLAYLFISHDLALVRRTSDCVAVLHLGQLCELGPAATVYARPLHPYTALLLKSSLSLPAAGEAPSFTGEAQTTDVPSPLHPPSGCRFRTRCPGAQARCAAEAPSLRRVDDEHFVACHFAL